MSDITKCLVENCPYAISCYRKLAEDDKWQSYAEFYMCNFDTGFQDYIKVITRDIKQ